MRFLKPNVLKSFEIQVGAMRFDPRLERLYDQQGQEINLRYLSRRVLGHLLRHRGEVVSRESLVRSVWQCDVVSDATIAQCISDIRKAIGDRKKRIVETIPRKGYRLAPDPVSPGPTRPRMSVDLSTEGERKTTIAVLPFEDFQITDINSETLRAAIAEAITTDLALQPELTVISRASSFQLSPNAPLTSVFARLQANFVVTGSLRSDGNNATATINLIEAKDESCVWVGTIDFHIREVLSMTRAISRRVANLVGAKAIDLAQNRIDLGEVSAVLIENAARSRMMRFQSKDAWLVNLYEQDIALERYSDSAWGHFGQALALRVGLDEGWILEGRAAVAAKAEQFVATALKLAPDNYLTQYALARTLAGKGEMIAAKEVFEKAARLNPASTLVLSGLIGQHLYLGETGMALKIIEDSERINPLHNYDLSHKKAWAYWLSGDVDAARDVLMTCPALNEGQSKLHAVVLMDLGEKDKARQVLKPFLEENPDWTTGMEEQLQSELWAPEEARPRWLSRLSGAGMPS
ncbi:winged helix-turn-helix domain-containing protein [Ruegeria atlantica]|uniref:winged helix-turn-helix domain-containing protein n=1 Tax=Ruegeria atlantica TaxID=81569 RepID=UPI0024950220|nr:winged helix-turn-helix domain-containing protein [Ruegeria atlantica]